MHFEAIRLKSLFFYFWNVFVQLFLENLNLEKEPNKKVFFFMLNEFLSLNETKVENNLEFV